VQLSAVAPQLVHAPPFVPQVEDEGALQVVPLQQPLGHDVELQTQAPPTHCWPAAQAGLLPQRHAPLVEQLLAPMPQLTHAAPAGPHWEVVVGAMHCWLALQQPLGHDE
jgi:hypothetical protein